MCYIKVNLGKALEILNISANKLALECKIKPNTIYELNDNKKDRITFNTLARLIHTLNRLANESGISYRFEVKDILEYIECKNK